MIGYVLLIALAVMMSAIVYQWLKTYVPKDAVQCPDGVSVFIKDISYDCTNKRINLTLKNNGKFSIAGYFIHATNNSAQKIATIDISSNILSSNLENEGNVSEGSVVYSYIDNNFWPQDGDDLRSSTFNVSSYGTIYKVDIIPVRYQEYNNRQRLVSCGQSRIIEEISCDR